MPLLLSSAVLSHGEIGRLLQSEFCDVLQAEIVRRFPDLSPASAVYRDEKRWINSHVLSLVSPKHCAAFVKKREFCTEDFAEALADALLLQFFSSQPCDTPHGGTPRRDWNREIFQGVLHTRLEKVSTSVERMLQAYVLDTSRVRSHPIIHFNPTTFAGGMDMALRRCGYRALDTSVLMLLMVVVVLSLEQAIAQLSNLLGQLLASRISHRYTVGPRPNGRQHFNPTPP